MITVLVSIRFVVCNQSENIPLPVTLRLKFRIDQPIIKLTLSFCTRLIDRHPLLRSKALTFFIFASLSTVFRGTFPRFVPCWLDETDKTVNTYDLAEFTNILLATQFGGLLSKPGFPNVQPRHDSSRKHRTDSRCVFSLPLAAVRFASNMESNGNQTHTHECWLYRNSRCLTISADSIRDHAVASQTGCFTLQPPNGCDSLRLLDAAVARMLSWAVVKLEIHAKHFAHKITILYKSVNMNVI